MRYLAANTAPIGMCEVWSADVWAPLAARVTSWSATWFEGAGSPAIVPTQVKSLPQLEQCSTWSSFSNWQFGHACIQPLPATIIAAYGDGGTQSSAGDG